ncbi:hypothetical protein [Halorussus caseinilyticus]|uniref:Uncharacterized protein n=1 Tax=Halorussus caseinilyticus TaxID=3034025 RepID=A0ABD5WIM2_9EURY|nr:hypothetical protein [Halorussus sp. DT72]
MSTRTEFVRKWFPDWKAAVLDWLPEPVDPNLEEVDHDYPPDEFFDRYRLVSFTRLFVLLAFLATAASLFRVGNPDTGIPYNYPVFVGFVYVVAVIFVLRRFHGIFDETKTELVDIFERTTEGEIVFERDSDITGDEMRREINRIMNYAFHPYFVFFGGLIGGVFALAVMWGLDVFDSYPYLLLNYAYGAGHGFFYAPFIGSVVLIKRISNEYIVDIDVLDPDGVGGYRDIGDAIISLIIYGIFLVTLDFVILSSVSFTGRPVFQVAVFTLYAGMLAFLLGLTVFGVYSLRKRLLTIRERKTDFMREQFETVEARYWKKLRDGDPPDPESDHIQTMQTMFDQLYSMELWPINLASFARLAFSAGSSAAIAAYKAGLVSLPAPL